MKIDTLTVKEGPCNEFSKLYTIKAGRKTYAKIFERAAGDCQLEYGGMAFDFPNFEAALERAVVVRKNGLEAFGDSYEIKVRRDYLQSRAGRLGANPDRKEK